MRTKRKQSRAWDNFGKPVTSIRLGAGERTLKEMFPSALAKERFDILAFFRGQVERDEPAVLIGDDPPAPADALDLTARYRLLATLLAGDGQ